MTKGKDISVEGRDVGGWMSALLPSPPLLPSPSLLPSPPPFPDIYHMVIFKNTKPYFKYIQLR